MIIGRHLVTFGGDSKAVSDSQIGRAGTKMSQVCFRFLSKPKEWEEASLRVLQRLQKRFILRDLCLRYISLSPRLVRKVNRSLFFIAYRTPFVIFHCFTNFPQCFIHFVQCFIRFLNASFFSLYLVLFSLSTGSFVLQTTGETLVF